MSKTLISVLVVGVVVVGGYFILKGNKPVQNPATEESGNSAPLETLNPGKKMAFSEFAKQGGSYKCEVKQSMSDVQNSGTVYMSSGKMRGEFSTIAEGRTIDTTFIMSDGYSYTWSSALPSMGFKVKINTDASVGNANASASGTYSFNANQIGDYNCVAWTADQSKFAVPTNITFKTVGA